MPQWEYQKLDLNDAPRGADEIVILNDAGRDGWELVAITPNNVAIFKRQVALPSAQSTSRRPATSHVLVK
jgi:hypothetical protein